MKSCTNDFHGSLFEYHNDSDLQARNFFDQKRVERCRAEIARSLEPRSSGSPLVISPGRSPAAGGDSALNPSILLWQRH